MIPLYFVSSLFFSLLSSLFFCLAVIQVMGRVNLSLCAGLVIHFGVMAMGRRDVLWYGRAMAELFYPLPSHIGLHVCMIAGMGC
ncbi:hypothetical protein QBC47DRAFT_379845 [Echria macrotheca]|uniref:Uncharacterized protein n=1 Tax=Echria macrotheca TaxID=438768 RepID=A0AAJ0F752_9PEZI|nr:hypothetical protein QBC47DRAFT_379845 [Echria macrotheca]